MPAKKSSVQSPDEDDAGVTSDEASVAFQDISKEMEKHRLTSDDGNVAAWNIPVPLMRAAAMPVATDGQQHALAVRGLRTVNVATMKNTLGHSGSLSSSNFLVREEMEQVSKEGVYTWTHHNSLTHTHTHCRVRASQEPVRRQARHLDRRGALRELLHCT